MTTVAARRFKRILLTSSLALALVLGGEGPGTWSASAQEGNLFAPRVVVNGRAVTEYEVIQRAMFIKLLGGAGDPEGEAVKALTDEKLKRMEADRLGITLTEEQVLAGMAEFAGRANLAPEEFLGALGQGGVAAETFRDFVAVGILWREVIRAKYAGTLSVSEVEVDRAIEGETRRVGLRVLMSELVIPVRDEAERADATALAERIRSETSGEGGFAAAVRRYSAAPSAGRGGRLEWLSLSNLPATLTKFVVALDPGQVSDPVQVPNAVVLFQLREIAEDPAVLPVPSLVEYARLTIPDDPALIAEIRSKSDRCVDLNAFAKGQPDAALVIEKQPVDAIPQDIAIELAQLDAGESSTALARDGQRLFLMMCAREPVIEPAPVDPEAAPVEAGTEAEAVPAINRDAIRERLLNTKAQGQSEALLEELRAAATIEVR